MIPLVDPQERSKAGSSPVRLHLSNLSFSAHSSTKIAPMIDTSHKLLQHYVVESFISDGDPLLVRQTPELETNIVYSAYS